MTGLIGRERFNSRCIALRMASNLTRPKTIVVIVKFIVTLIVSGLLGWVLAGPSAAFWIGLGTAIWRGIGWD